jgi:multiple antibiotic resistance protein
MTAAEAGLRAFATFFATVSPVDVAVLFAVFAAHVEPRQRRRMAIRGVGIATALLLAFALFGGAFLELLGIGLPALQTAGGILLLLMAIEMVFARPSGMSGTTAAETSEAENKADLSVFPLATPLIAGPGAIGAAVLLMAEAGGDLARQTVVIVALLAVMTITLVLLRLAARLHAVLGVTGQNVITRVIGILLAALAVQFLFDGVGRSGLFATGFPYG